MTVNDHALQRLRLILDRMENGAEPEIEEITAAREEVLARYQPIFSAENLPILTEEEFRGFLSYKNNRHWISLQRLGGRVTENMDVLREALLVLVDDNEPIEKRLRRLRPPRDDPMVKYLGRSIITPILLVTHPDEYGVLNSVSESGLRELELWPDLDRGADFAERYLAVNEVLRETASRLDVDLWTLDALWYRVGGDEPGDGEEPKKSRLDDAETGIGFGLERHLQDFLFDNWDQSTLGGEWELYETDGEIVGFEYDTREIGRIDLLARHRSEPRWLVVELKRGRSSDRAVGQLLRYRSWVKRNLADGETVDGLVICREAGPKIRYALADVPGVEVVTYSVDFALHEVDGL